METQEKQAQTIEGQVVRGETQIAAREQVVELDPIRVIEQRNRAFERVLEYAVRSTEPGDWFDQNGKPYLGAAGSEKVARRFGVRITNVKRERIDGEDRKGVFFEYIVEATFSLPGGIDSIEAMGTCSSRDNFLGTETNAGREVEDIDTGNILKAAYSNCIVNGVTRLVGIRNLSWERLAQLGIAQGATNKVEYKHGSKGGGSGKEFTFPFGKAKGKTLAEASDADLTYYLKAFTENAADPEKSKYREQNEKQVKAVEGEITRRKNGSKPQSLWTRIQALAGDYEFPRGDKDADLIAFVKAVTNGKPGKDLSEDDFAAVEKAMAAAVTSGQQNDIPY